MAADSFNAQQLAAHKDEFARAYEELRSRNLALNLTRGRPSSGQLDPTNTLLGPPAPGYIPASGENVRNYGNAKGITGIRAIRAEPMGLPMENVLAQDASNPNIQLDLISWATQFGNVDSEHPWNEEPVLKRLCSAPEYGRHFIIARYFGIEMTQAPLDEDGPDMDAVEKLIAPDPQIRDMWNTPVSSNPTSVTYNVEVHRRLVEMETAAPDFHPMWDNAYMVHMLTDEFPEIYNVIKWVEEVGNPNRVQTFGSTSKITFTGTGIAFYASSNVNLEDYLKHVGIHGIGPNKVNQLTHAKFFGGVGGMCEQMRRHAGSLTPKFKETLQILDERLSKYDVVEWSKPTGGYFINLGVVDGTARRVVELAKEAGTALIGSGSPFPLKQDPNNHNIRLAPSLPLMGELRIAMGGVAICVLLAAAEKAVVQVKQAR